MQQFSFFQIGSFPLFTKKHVLEHNINYTELETIKANKVNQQKITISITKTLIEEPNSFHTWHIWFRRGLSFVFMFELTYLYTIKKKIQEYIWYCSTLELIQNYSTLIPCCSKALLIINSNSSKISKVICIS